MSVPNPSYHQKFPLSNLRVNCSNRSNSIWQSSVVQPGGEWPMLYNCDEFTRINVSRAVHEPPPIPTSSLATCDLFVGARGPTRGYITCWGITRQTHPNYHLPFPSSLPFFAALLFALDTLSSSPSLLRCLVLRVRRQAWPTSRIHAVTKDPLIGDVVRLTLVHVIRWCIT
ncbi:hypothetical protein V565_008950 [Rhizoctonia solani 123E]|uniref:Uncharacterized protein n=1 Tax=Rhizoctonia solani 123E TaxID=1423351 RepID=A0A074SZ67_9AGAM|nr:hypothetical protein V565_008950 [Rhizoctonia solani 123E]